MNRAALVIFISCFLWNCGERMPNNGIERSIQLANDLGTVRIWLPARFDTSFTWMDMSDHKCGDERKVRWVDSRYSIEQESGEFYFSKPDSLYQFTVSQSESSDCHSPADLAIDTKWLQEWRTYYKAFDENLVFEIDTIDRINGNNFAVIAFQQESGDSMSIATLAASTMVNKKIIKLSFNCYAKDCSGFIDTMYRSLKTAEITE